MFSEIFCEISGKVQRVGYRDFVERMARERGLTGYVENKENGNVEVLLQGYPDELKLCIEELNIGSVLSRVEGMSVDWRTPKKQFEDFKIIV